MRRGESPTSSNTLFFMFIFLIISQVQARKHQQVCSSSCGNIKHVSAPFRLKSDPAECGDPNFELSNCHGDKAILQMRSGKYYVEEILDNRHEISEFDQRIRVVDVNFASGNCGLPSQSVSNTDTLYYDNITGKTLGISNYSFDWRTYTFDWGTYKHFTEAKFLNCSRNLSQLGYIRIPCLSGNQSQVYVNYDGGSISNLPESCSLISSVPILEGIENYPSYETIRKFLHSGFYLVWSSKCYPDGYSPTAWFYCSKKTFVDYLLLLLEYMFFILYELLQFAIGDTHTQLFHVVYGISCSLLLCFMSAVLVVRFIPAPIVLLVFIINKYRTTRKTVDNVEKFLHNQQSWMPKRYSYPEIIAMTNHFREKLGQGGFGSVYKGQLHCGSLIAVKVLEQSKFSAEDFINEVSTIGRIHHVNIVQLVGFCSEGSKRALVYEYMLNGSLDRHIFSKECKGQSFNWEKLHEIALGTARGIEYLHGGCDVCILHFDIKPHNILLDHNFIPKVSDFGLAKFYPKENDFVSISATRGTIGYIAPELISRNFGVVSCKSDVYSFGMLLLEMAGGRRNSFSLATRSSKAYFPSWIYDQIQKGRDSELQDVIENQIGIARKLCIIGLWCIQVNAADRPSITKVREMLEGSIIDLEMPPKPCFSSSQHISMREIESDSSTELLLTESMEECL